MTGNSEMHSQFYTPLEKNGKTKSWFKFWITGSTSVIIPNTEMSLILTKNTSTKQKHLLGDGFFLVGGFFISPAKPDLYRPSIYLYLPCTTRRNHCPKWPDKLLLWSWSADKHFSTVKLTTAHLFFSGLGGKGRKNSRMDHSWRW